MKTIKCLVQSYFSRKLNLSFNIHCLASVKWGSGMGKGEGVEGE